MLRILLAVSLSFLGTARLPADTSPKPEPRTLERTLEARPQGQVLVQHLAGSLEIRGWDRDRVQISATLGPEARNLHTRSDGQRIWIEIEPEADLAPDKAETRLVVSVPARSKLQVRSASAEIELLDLTGPVDLEATSGAVRFANPSGAPADEVVLTTVSGDIMVAASCRILRARSVEGALRIDHPSQDLEAETATGDIFLDAPVLRESRIESGSGRIRVQGAVAEIGRLRIYSHEGPVELQFPTETEALFDLETRSGSILGEAGSPAGELDTRGNWQLRTGNTAAQVHVRSFRGDIQLMRP